MVLNAEFVAEEALTQQELPDQRLAARQVGVCLDPHAALRLPAALGDVFPHLLVDLRRILLDEVIQLRLRGHEQIIRVVFQQAECRRKGARRLVPCNMVGPLPRHVDVRMAD